MVEQEIRAFQLTKIFQLIRAFQFPASRARRASLMTRHHSNQLLFPSLTTSFPRQIVFGRLYSDREHPRETVNLLTNEVMLLSLAYLTSLSLTSLRSRLPHFSASGIAHSIDRAIPCSGDAEKTILFGSPHETEQKAR